MPTASNAQIDIEAGQSLVTYVAMTDSGDHTVYTSAAAIWSGASGKEPSIRPNGIVSGVNVVTPAVSGSNDVVDVAAFTAYSVGVLKSVSASTDESITRASTDVAVINSVQMTSAGAISVVKGTDATDSNFSETRGAAGGPPYVLADSVEVAQVRVTTNTAGPIVASEIFQVVGTHTERSDFPTWTTNNIGDGSNASVSSKVNAYIAFGSALPLSHTGDVTKKTYIQYYTPTFQTVSKALDFVPAETSQSVSSTQYYRGTIASTSSTLNQGSFTALMEDGIADTLVTNKNDVLTVRFYPDANKTPYVLTQGTIGLARTFPVADQIQAAVTISAEVASAEFTS